MCPASEEQPKRRSGEHRSNSVKVTALTMLRSGKPAVEVSRELGREVLMERKATTELDFHVGMYYTAAAVEMGVMLHQTMVMVLMDQVVEQVVEVKE